MSDESLPIVDPSQTTSHGEPDGAPNEAGNAQSGRFSSPASRWDRAARYSAYVLIFLAAATGFYYVHAFGVNIFWWDEWSSATVLFEQYASGTLTAATFWAQHNEHRIVFPKLLILGLGLLTKGSAVANMYLIEALLLAILVVFIVAFRKQFTQGTAIWLMAPVAFLVFSLRQYENMLWGFQIAFVMVVAAALGAFLGLSRLRNERYYPKFVCATLAATVATYSSIQGLLVWPIGLGLLLIAPLAKRLKIVLMTVWTIIGAVEWLVYFIDWVKPQSHPALGFSWDFLLTLIGGSLFGDQSMALVAGILVLVLATAAAVIVLISRQWNVQSFWLATMVFALATLGAITLGRSGLGELHAVDSRYATFSIPLVVATYVIFASQNGEKTSRICGLLAGAVLGLTLLGTGVSFIEGLKMGRQWKEVREWQQLVLCTIDSQPDEMIVAYPHKEVVRRYTEVLKKLNYNLFADPELCARCRLPDPSLPVLTTTTKYGIDEIAPMPLGKLMSIRGWAVDLPAGDVAGGVTVVIDGVAHQAYYGLRNDNAVKNLNSRKYLFSGFNCIVPAKEIGPGKHAFMLKVLSHDNKAVFDIPEQFSFDLLL